LNRYALYDVIHICRTPYMVYCRICHICHKCHITLQGRGGGGDRSALGSASSHRYMTSHLVRPPVVPHEDNSVVIVPSGDM
jgi:hypothetical protein